MYRKARAPFHSITKCLLGHKLSLLLFFPSILAYRITCDSSTPSTTYKDCLAVLKTIQAGSVLPFGDIPQIWSRHVLTNSSDNTVELPCGYSLKRTSERQVPNNCEIFLDTFKGKESTADEFARRELVEAGTALIDSCYPAKSGVVDVTGLGYVYLTTRYKSDAPGRPNGAANYTAFQLEDQEDPVIEQPIIAA